MNSAENIVKNVCKIQKDEKVLIIANPQTEVISKEIYKACVDCNAKTSLVFQEEKTSFDNAEDTVIAAIKTNPDVCFSISSCKLGKDKEATANPYKTSDGQEYSHIFDYLLDGKKSMRAVWTPGITYDMYTRTVNIDYEELKNNCKKLEKYFEGASFVKVTAPSGTDIEIPVENRKLLFDDGDFSAKGSGGNIPAGEVFISPLIYDKNNEKNTNGKIVFDGSMTFSDGDSILETPITCIVKDGFVSEITGGTEACRLLKTITEAEKRAIDYESNGKLPKGMGEVYKKNARNIGELGIGLNPNAKITGNMLEDEKAFTTCHFAIGENYDNDAPSLIHLDGVVKNPTIEIFYKNKQSVVILKDGILTV